MSSNANAPSAPRPLVLAFILVGLVTSASATALTGSAVALAGTDISDDGEWLLYGVSTHGSDWIEWHVKNITTGQELPDVIKWSKGGGTWDRTAAGFYYGRLPEPKPGEEFTSMIFGPWWLSSMSTPATSSPMTRTAFTAASR